MTKGEYPKQKLLTNNSLSDDQLLNAFSFFFYAVGSIIRCMRRLEELLRQMCQASKAIGNTELENKFAEGENQALFKAAMLHTGFKVVF